MEAAKNLTANDHDLLIRLDENVRNLTTEIKKLGDDSVKRLNEVEAEKLDRDDFDTFKDEVAKEVARIEATAKSELARVETLHEKDQKDIEIRMRTLERFVYIAIGVITVIDMIGIPLFLKYIN